MYYLVFYKQHIPKQSLAAGMPSPPARDVMAVVPAIFRCADAETACKAAAKRVGTVGTYFAIEGSPWGLDLMDVDGVEVLGEEPDEADAQERRLRALERGLLDKDVPV